MTIDETWEAVARCFLWHEQPTSEVQQQTRNEQAIVAAFGQSVLEEADAQMHEVARQINDGFLWETWQRRSEAVRAQINALVPPQPHGEHAEPPQQEGT